MLHPTKDVFKASIIGRRGALGVVHENPIEERFTRDREMLLSDIKICLAGFAAEKMRFNTTSDGVDSDFRQAMSIAHNMVWRWGMNDSGLIGDYTLIPESQISDGTKETLNQETNKIIKSCLKDVEDLLNKEKEVAERFVKELLEKQELDYDEIDAIFKEYGKVSVRGMSTR